MNIKFNMKINLGTINFHANQKRLELIYFLIKLLPLKYSTGYGLYLYTVADKS